MSKIASKYISCPRIQYHPPESRSAIEFYDDSEFPRPSPKEEENDYSRFEDM